MRWAATHTVREYEADEEEEEEKAAAWHAIKRRRQQAQQEMRSARLTRDASSICEPWDGVLFCAEVLDEAEELVRGNDDHRVDVASLTPLEQRLANAMASAYAAANASPPRPVQHTQAAGAPELPRRRLHDIVRTSRPLGGASRLQRGRRMMLLASRAEESRAEDGGEGGGSPTGGAGGSRDRMLPSDVQANPLECRDESQQSRFETELERAGGATTEPPEQESQSAASGSSDGVLPAGT